MNVQANFAIDTYTVTFTVGPHGTLSGDTTQMVVRGGNCTPVTALSDTGYHFAAWSGDDTSTDNPLTITNVTSNMNVQANFAIDTYVLTVNLAGTGNGTVTPDVGEHEYDYGTVVNLTASPGATSTFEGWSSDALVTSNSTITMDTDKSVTATFMADSDNDGISDEEENAAPNSGDGNNDTINDSDQVNVASLHTHDEQNYVTLALYSPYDTHTLSDVHAIDNPSPSDAPQGVDFPYGFFEFTVKDVGPGGSTVLTLHLPAGSQIDTYYKFGPTPDDPTYHWYEFLYDEATKTGAKIDGDVVTLHFVDGERGDDDLTADGDIEDAGGPGFADAMKADDGGGSGGCFITTAGFGLPQVGVGYSALHFGPTITVIMLVFFVIPIVFIPLYRRRIDGKAI